MTEILSEISYYDKHLHLPVPKLSYIKERTGFDLYLEVGSELKAKAYVKTYTKAAWDYLRSSKIMETANAMEYLIATKENWRGEFLEYVIALINSIYITGGVEVFTATDKIDLTDDLPAMVRASLGGLLKAKRLTTRYKYRKGY